MQDYGSNRDSGRTLKFLRGQDLPARTQNPKSEIMDRIEKPGRTLKLLRGQDLPARTQKP